jgi:hypothetical protein
MTKNPCRLPESAAGVVESSRLGISAGRLSIRSLVSEMRLKKRSPTRHEKPDTVELHRISPITDMA